jgi:hypothetical protein
MALESGQFIGSSKLQADCKPGSRFSAGIHPTLSLQVREAAS